MEQSHDSERLADLVCSVGIGSAINKILNSFNWVRVTGNCTNFLHRIPIQRSECAIIVLTINIYDYLMRRIIGLNSSETDICWKLHEIRLFFRSIPMQIFIV